MPDAQVRDYSDVTEVPGLPVTRIQLARTYHRYEMARAQVAGKDVLEIACGAGQGLGLLASAARRVVGGDYTEGNLLLARAAHGRGVPLVRLDAQSLPFPDASFDVVVMLEAVYYLPDAEAALAECKRMLRAGGRLVISTVNPAWPDFGRSIHSTRYFDSAELEALLRRHGLRAEIFGAFPESSGPAARARSLIRRVAMRVGMVPGSLRAKAMLKQVFYGSLRAQPAKLDPQVASGERATPIPAGTVDTRHSILYAIGSRA